MNRDGVIETLKNAEVALRARGVDRAALFGSVARGSDGPDSDIDILVQIRDDAQVDLFAYIGIVHLIEDLFSRPVDVANWSQLKPHVRPSAERDAVHVF